MNLICSSRLMCSMLIVTFIFILLMIHLFSGFAYTILICGHVGDRPLMDRWIKNLIRSSRVISSMLTVNFLVVLLYVILLMILFVDVGSSCTVEDGVKLVEVLDLAVVVHRVPMIFEEGAPVGCGAIIHGL